MPDVRLVCFYNQFDAKGKICTIDFDTAEQTTLREIDEENISEIIDYYTELLDSDKVYLAGDNEVFLEGLKERTLYDYKLKYGKENINIMIAADMPEGEE